MRKALAGLALSLTFGGAAVLGQSAQAAVTHGEYLIGTRLYIDCAAQVLYLESRDQDMSGSFIEVTIDGVRQPDVEVDSGGTAGATYALSGGPHSASILFDLVNGGSEGEQDQTLAVQCEPAGTEPTSTTAAPVTTAPSTTTPSTVPPVTTTAAPVTTTTSTTLAPATTSTTAGTKPYVPAPRPADCRPLKRRGCI